VACLGWMRCAHMPLCALVRGLGGSARCCCCCGSKGASCDPSEQSNQHLFLLVYSRSETPCAMPSLLQVPGFQGSVSFITSMTKAFCSGGLI